MCENGDGFEGIDCKDIALAGALADEIAADEKQKQRLMKEVQPEEEKNEEDSG